MGSHIAMAHWVGVSVGVVDVGVQTRWQANALKTLHIYIMHSNRFKIEIAELHAIIKY